MISTERRRMSFLLPVLLATAGPAFALVQAREVPPLPRDESRYAEAGWDDASVGTNATPAWNQSVALFRDADGDGVRDVLVGSPAAPYSGVVGVTLLSGRTGKEIFRLDAVEGRTVGEVGDVDGDGVEDFLVGGSYSFGGLYSGADGTFLRTVPSVNQGLGAAHFGKMPDLNGDGRAELVIGNSDATAYRIGCCTWVAEDGGVRRVWLLDGATGALLLEILPPSHANYGTVVGAVGDVDGDGLADIGVGAGVFDHMGYGSIAMPSGIGFDVYSSASGQLLWTAATKVAELEVLDDLDGDGVPELALGGTLESTVEIRSGSTGALLRTLRGRRDNDGFGYSMATSDWDGDGALDLVVGAHRFAGITSSYAGTFFNDADGYVQVIDPRSGLVLQAFDGATEDWGLGAAVVALSDATGDGRPDVGALAPRSDVHPAGVYRVLSQAPLGISTSASSLSAAAGGTVTFSALLGSENAGDLAFLFGSASGPTPSTIIGGVEVPLVLDAYTLLLAPTISPVVLDATGFGRVALDVPPGFGGAGIVGTTLDHAFLVFDATTGAIREASWSLPTTFLP